MVLIRHPRNRFVSLHFILSHSVKFYLTLRSLLLLSLSSSLSSSLSLSYKVKVHLILSKSIWPLLHLSYYIEFIEYHLSYILLLNLIYCVLNNELWIMTTGMMIEEPFQRALKLEVFANTIRRDLSDLLHVSDVCPVPLNITSEALGKTGNKPVFPNW